MPSGGLGLASMRERASAAGGTLTVRSGPAGTRVRMTVPVNGGPAKTGPAKTGPAKPGGQR
jgi:signal transduction histidine kinase